jgi:hypothetical protein
MAGLAGGEARVSHRAVCGRRTASWQRVLAEEFVGDSCRPAARTGATGGGQIDRSPRGFSESWASKLGREKPNQSTLRGAEARGEKGGAAAALGSTRQGRRWPNQPAEGRVPGLGTGD